jgi:hypothetical protein
MLRLREEHESSGAVVGSRVAEGVAAIRKFVQSLEDGLLTRSNLDLLAVRKPSVVI